MTAEIDRIRAVLAQDFIVLSDKPPLDLYEENTNLREAIHKLHTHANTLLKEIDRLTTITTLHERDLVEYREAANKGVKGFRAQIEELKVQNTALREVNERLTEQRHDAIMENCRLRDELKATLKGGDDGN